MALIRTAAEAKAAIPRVLSKLSNTAEIPDTSVAESKYLVPLIGQALYDQINDKINADPVEDLTDEETALLVYMRRVSAYFSYLDDLGTDNAKITDNGIRSAETAGMPRAFGWSYKELKNDLQSKAWDSVEVLLKFLFENKGDYDAWTDSDEYKSISDLIIKSGIDFDAHYKLFQPLRTFYSLKGLIDEVQEELIEPAIGEELLAYFIALEDPTDDEKKILKLLKKSTAYMVIKKACEHYTVRFDSNGVTILGGGDSENPEVAGRTSTTDQHFDKKIQSCDMDSQNFLDRAKKKLYALSIDEDAEEAFVTAYNAGPLATYDPTSIVRDRKNDIRKGFRF